MFHCVAHFRLAPGGALPLELLRVAGSQFGAPFEAGLQITFDARNLTRDTDVPAS